MSMDFHEKSQLTMHAPDRCEIRVPPPAVPVPFLDATKGELPFPPSHGEHTNSVLEEAGLGKAKIEALRGDGAIA